MSQATKPCLTSAQRCDGLRRTCVFFELSQCLQQATVATNGRADPISRVPVIEFDERRK